MRAPALRPTFAELEARLAADGFAPDPALASPSPPATDVAELPWFARVLVGLGAWLSACFLLGLVGLVLGGALESGALILGPLLIAAGAAVLRARSGASGVELFLRQGALAGVLAGQGLFIFGIGKQAGDEATAVAALAVAGATIAFVREPVVRFLSTLGAAGALGWLLVDAHVPHSFDLLALALAATAGWLWLGRPARFARTGEDALASVGYAVTVAFLATLLLAARLGPLGSMPWEGDLAPPGRVAATGLGLLAVALALLVRRELGLGRPTPFGAAALAGLMLLGPVTPGTPGLVGAVAVLLLALHRREPILLGLAVVFLIVFLGAFYYALAVSLLVKSILLGLAGAALLGGALALARRASP